MGGEDKGPRGVTIDDLMNCPACKGQGWTGRGPEDTKCSNCDGSGLAFTESAARAIVAGTAVVPSGAPIWNHLADKLEAAHAEATGKHLQRLCECGQYFQVAEADDPQLHCPACVAGAKSTLRPPIETRPGPAYMGGTYQCSGCKATVEDPDTRPALIDGDDLYCPACVVRRVMARVQAVPQKGGPLRPSITCYDCNATIGPTEGCGVQLVAQPTKPEDPVGRGRVIPAVQVRCYKCACRLEATLCQGDRTRRLGDVVVQAKGGRVAHTMLMSPKYSTQPTEE